METARPTRRVEEDEVPFELKSNTGIEASLRKLLGGFEICGGGLGATTHEPPSPAKAEKPEPEVEVANNNRSVIPAELSSSETAKPPTGCSNADNETCGESQTTTGSMNDEKVEKTAPATTDDDEPSPAKKETTEEKDESVPTTQDRSLETTTTETQPETEEESQTGSGWAGWVWILFVVAVATLMAASLNMERGTDIEGLGMQVKQFLEEKLAENAQASVNLKDIAEETVASVEEDEEATTTSDGEQDTDHSAEGEDEEEDDIQQSTQEHVEEDSTFGEDDEIEENMGEEMEYLDEEKLEIVTEIVDNIVEAETDPEIVEDDIAEEPEPVSTETKPTIESALDDDKIVPGNNDDDTSSVSKKTEEDELAELQRELAKLKRGWGIDHVPPVKEDKAGMMTEEL